MCKVDGLHTPDAVAAGGPLTSLHLSSNTCSRDLFHLPLESEDPWLVCWCVFCQRGLGCRAFRRCGGARTSRHKPGCAEGGTVPGAR